MASNYDGHEDNCDCAVCDDIRFRKSLKLDVFESGLSKRGKDWLIFASKVLEHIELYTVSQYGDKGSDLASEYTIEEMLKQAEKYIKRYGRNQREGQQELDFMKAAHYIQMGATKYDEEKENN